MATLRENKYGKTGVRLVKVTRHGNVHTLREWTVRVLLEGDFASAHLLGDNSKILPTDTMKNTVYSRAKESRAESMEEFAAELVEFLLGRNPQASACEVHIEQAAWQRILVDG
ncbi:MAG: urate oxidase, partial [Terriglobus sp.]